MSIGQNIVRFRKEAGFSQKQLAALLQIRPEQLSQWENDKREPNAENIKRLSKALLVSTDCLLDNDLSNETENEIINYSVAMAYSPKERELIDQYRKLDAYGKNALQAVLEAELFRISECSISEE